MRERQSLFSATGIPSLFLIFAVLMLVTLSLLGYGTSRQGPSVPAGLLWNRPEPTTKAVLLPLTFTQILWQI